MQSKQWLFYWLFFRLEKRASEKIIGGHEINLGQINVKQIDYRRIQRKGQIFFQTGKQGVQQRSIEFSQKRYELFDQNLQAIKVYLNIFSPVIRGNLYFLKQNKFLFSLTYLFKYFYELLINIIRIYSKLCQAIFTGLYIFISFLNNYSALMQKSYKSIILLLILTLNLTSQMLSCELGSIQANDICIKCQNIPNTLPSTKLSQEGCICKDGYSWSKEEAACSAKQQSIFSIKESDIEITDIFPEVSQHNQDPKSQRRLQNTPTCDSTSGFILFTQNRLKISVPSICINCLSLPYTLGKTLTNNTCTCQQSFYWPDQWPSCYCLQQSAINPQQNSCQPCTIITDTSIRLKCLDCITPYTKSLYGCVNCLLLANNGGTSSCCSTGFIFSFKMAECICDRSKGYAINSAGNCIKCPTNDNNCLNCNNSYVFDNQQCRHGSLIPNYDFQTTFKCLQGFSFLVNPVTGQIASCSCSSSQGYYLNGSTCLPCSSTLPSGITQIQCTSCSNSAGFYNSITQCILCTGISNSIGTANTNGCNCKNNYYWNTITGKCQCDYSLGFIKRNGDDCFSCTDAPNGGSVVFNTACSCAKGYIWNPTNFTCDCDLLSPGASFSSGVCFNCIGMIGSSGYFAVNNTACRCINGYFWNPARGRCECSWAFNFAVFPDGFCKDCSLAAYSNGLATAQGCVCINGLSWNPKTSTCTCSNGFVMVGNTCRSCSSAQLSTSATISDCRNCLNSKGFALLAGICYRCSTQIGASSVVSNNRCVCPGVGQVWKPQLGSCICDWSKTYVTYLNPDNRTYTCSICPYLKKDNSCACGMEFLFFDQKNKICTDCQNDPNSYLDAKFNCFCNQGFDWSQQVYPYRCVPKLNIGKGYFSSINNSYFSCSTLTNDLIESCSICSPDLGFVLVPNRNQCLFCRSVLGSTGVASYNGCVCNSTREWDPISLTCDPIKCLPSMVYNALNSRCVCNPLNSILVNGNCVSCGSLANSNGFARTTIQCGCIPPSTWVGSRQGGSCVASSSAPSCNTTTSIVVNGACFACPSSLGGLGSARNNTCLCSPQFYWLGNSAGGMCVCNTTISYIVNSICLACPISSSTSLSTGLSDGKGGCSCINSTVWIVTNGIGRCSPCNMADNVILLTNSQCFICGTVNTYTSTKIVSSSNNSCNCQSLTLTWNPIGVCDCGSNSAMLIIGTTFTCFTCNNPSALTSSKATSTSCRCISSNLIWNETSRSCGCNNSSNQNIIMIGSGASSSCFDCMGYSLSIQASANRRSCVCKGQLTWMASSSTCDCQANQIMVGLNCITCSSLQYTSTVINKTTCSCLGTGLIFNSNGGCSCPSSSIILPNFTCFGCPTGSTPLTSYECLCPLGSVWIYSSRSCRRCGTTDIPNSLPFGGSRMACQCTTNYIWDAMTQTCILTSLCLTPSPSCMNCGVGLNAAILIPSSSRNLSQGATIQQMLNGSFTNYNILSAYQCPCAANTNWDALRLRCFDSNLL